MKALYLYSDKTGIKKSEKKVQRLNDSLKDIYKDIDIIKTSTLEEFEKQIRGSIGKYQILIVAGGDGTLKFVTDVLLSYKKKERPTLGYIPTGTVNDAGKAFGANGSIKHALKVLAKGETDYIDVCKVNDTCFNFVCAAGAYSDISYAVKRGPKKILGKFAYYFYALKEVFHRYSLVVDVETKNEKFTTKTPFIMVLNSKNVGGFPVNLHYSVKDGLAEVYITKPGLLNGLLHYVFFKFRTIKIKTDYIKLTLHSDEPWCFDGEKGDNKEVEIKVLKQELKVIGKAKK